MLACKFTGQQGSSQHMMWSWFHYRTQFVSLVYFKSITLFGDLLRASPFLNVFLSTLGARVSSTAIVNTIWMSGNLSMICTRIL